MSLEMPVLKKFTVSQSTEQCVSKYENLRHQNAR